MAASEYFFFFGDGVGEKNAVISFWPAECCRLFFDLRLLGLGVLVREAGRLLGLDSDAAAGIGLRTISS